MNSRKIQLLGQGLHDLHAQPVITNNIADSLFYNERLPLQERGFENCKTSTVKCCDITRIDFCYITFSGLIFVRLYSATVALI